MHITVTRRFTRGDRDDRSTLHNNVVTPQSSLVHVGERGRRPDSSRAAPRRVRSLQAAAPACGPLKHDDCKLSLPQIKPGVTSAPVPLHEGRSRTQSLEVDTQYKTREGRLDHCRGDLHVSDVEARDPSPSRRLDARRCGRRTVLLPPPDFETHFAVLLSQQTRRLETIAASAPPGGRRGDSGDNVSRPQASSPCEAVEANPVNEGAGLTTLTSK